MTRARPLFNLAGFALASLVSAAPGEAEAAMRTLVVKNDGAAKIAYYDSLCDEDNHVECLIAEIGCDSPGDFTASLFALDNKEAAALFAKSAGKGSVATPAGSESLQLMKLALSEFTYKWNATLISMERGREVWGALWSADTVQLQAGIRKVALQRSDASENAFREVVGACAAPAR